MDIKIFELILAKNGIGCLVVLELIKTKLSQHFRGGYIFLLLA